MGLRKRRAGMVDVMDLMGKMDEMDPPRGTGRG